MITSLIMYGGWCSIVICALRPIVPRAIAIASAIDPAVSQPVPLFTRFTGAVEPSASGARLALVEWKGAAAPIIHGETQSALPFYQLILGDLDPQQGSMDARRGPIPGLSRACLALRWP